MTVFTPEEREQIRRELVSAAKADTRIVGAAHLGSAAEGCLDRWSDIDLAVCVSPDADFDAVLSGWTKQLNRDYGVAAIHDVRRGTILYRVFLLANTLQIDLSFWPLAEFRAVGPKFALIFGSPGESFPAPVPDSAELIDMAWLYALHVRSSIARGRVLQAEYMLSGMRDNVLALACKRYGVTAVQGRGLDDLPAEYKVLAVDCLARFLEPDELKRAFRATTEALINEIGHTNSHLLKAIEAPLRTIVAGTVDGG